MAEEFRPSLNWRVPPADPNDALFGSLVSTRDIKDGFDFIIAGFPFDGSMLGRKGARDGPAAIRNAASKLKVGTYAARNLRKRIYDLGDFKLPGQNSHLARARIDAFSACMYGDARGYRQARAIALGGDHSITYHLAAPYLRDFSKRLVVVNLDAHLDVRATPAGALPNSGTSFRRLIDHGLKKYVAIGLRDFQTSPTYIDFARRAGAQLVSAAEVFDAGPRAIVRRILRSLRKDALIYLSIDIDVADASVAPGVSAPTPGGLLAHHLFELVRLIAADERTVAFDIVEVAPKLEKDGDRTARLAAGCLAEIVTASPGGKLKL
ncbi:MAG TPA: arginase family protein [Planctomycetota bacterium]|nr:arginase family protein [Planctomycetota bacterium]